MKQKLPEADVVKSALYIAVQCHNRVGLWTESDGGACFFIGLGKMPRCLQLSWPHIFWQIGCEAFTTDAHIAKISSAKLPLWPARRTWQGPSMHRSIKLNPSRTMQIMTNSIILHYTLSPANLPNSRESGRVSRCLSWGACCLTEWCWNCNPHPPFCLPFQLWPSHLLYLFWFFFCSFVWYFISFPGS